jgi:hypothetical protein
MPDLKFDLNDDVSVSDLRNVDRWFARLSRAGKLRLQRRGEVLGVLVSPREWSELKEQTEHYRQVLESVEDERDRRVIAEREHTKRLSGVRLRNSLERGLKKAGVL